ncbi:MAG: cytochrome-c peroxidase [Spirochaetia bacterium]|nr:cytochrome-c peroxidase [Spirochaetia bacterium]
MRTKFLTKTTIIIFSFSIFIFCSKENKKANELMNKAKETIGVLPDKMPGAENDTPKKIELGKKLYFETKLSITDTQSCNSCHLVDNKKGGVDNTQFSPGAKGSLGGRNAPTVLNAGFHIAQFWDGRAPDLKEQAKGPILNPVEMAMPNEQAVIDKISSLEDYQSLFKEAYPDSNNPITYDNLADAIAAFERTLITKDRFDDFQKGDLNALSEDELEGLSLFMNKLDCTQCHDGPLLGGNSYEKMGVEKPYKNTKDLGRFDVTKEEDDKYYFKVPSLRNIAITFPYFHDGGAMSLEDAVKTMADIQLNVNLTKEQIDKIVKFLKTLTDKERL